jgi:hypothetical protein
VAFQQHRGRRLQIGSHECEANLRQPVKYIVHHVILISGHGLHGHVMFSGALPRPHAGQSQPV